MIDTAIILAGGLGTRLRPLTNDTPKPLLPVKGKPILQHIIEHLQQQGIKKIIISIGYKAEIVQAYFGDGSKYKVQLSYSVENEPLGTGGAVKQAAQHLSKPFFLIWGDNLMDLDYHEMYTSYLRHAPQVTMALTPREDVENFGVALLQEHKIITFIEKPKREEAPSNLINAGAFVIEPSCLQMLPEGKSSIEKDCFEKLAPLGEISAYQHQGQWFPTDTLEKYSLASVEFTPKIDFTEKKMIIADVDDTICDSCQPITLKMAEQINSLIQKGYGFAFISGTKTDDLAKMISTRLKQEHHLLGATGTKYVLVSKAQQQHIMYNHSLSAPEKKEIIAALEKLSLTFNIQTLTTKEDQMLDRDSQITFSAIGRHAPTEHKRAFDPQGEKRKIWQEFLTQHLPAGKYEINIGGTTSLDITKKGLDKEWGIREFAKQNKIPLSHILFLGDKLYPGGNDYPAAKIVDCLAVKNPEDTLRKLKMLLSI